MSEDAPIGSIRPPCKRQHAEEVVRRLREAGHVAYFAGGCVRDLLLGLTPKDYDIATDAPPQRVRQLFPRTQAVGAAFGVILVHQGTSIVEVATFRADVSYQDGRRPTAVRFTTAEEDAQRRDFTINGLFYDPVENRVIDYVQGQRDLKDRVLRAIGDPDHRFEEDHLRLLRAVRFAARFGFAVEPRTAEAIRAHAPRLKRISPERIAEELRLTLTPPTRQAAWPMLWDFQLLVEVFRHLASARFVPLERERSVLLNCAPGQTIPVGLALAAATLCFRRHIAAGMEPAVIARDEAASLTRVMRMTLHLSNDEQDQMRRTLGDAGWMLLEPNPSVAALKRLVAGKHFAHARALLDALSRSGFHTEKVATLREIIADAGRGDIAPQPLITGEDLIQMGLTPGRLFKVVLDQVYDAQLEGRVSTREQAVEFVRRITA